MRAEGIAVHEQEVGEGARLHHAQLARAPHELTAELRRGHEGSTGEKPRLSTKTRKRPLGVRAVRCEHEAVVASGEDRMPRLRMRATASTETSSSCSKARARSDVTPHWPPACVRL